MGCAFRTHGDVEFGSRYFGLGARVWRVTSADNYQCGCRRRQGPAVHIRDWRHAHNMLVYPRRLTPGVPRGRRDVTLGHLVPLGR